MFDCDEMFTFETDESLPASPKYDRPLAHIIEDWISDSKNDSEAEIPQNASSFVQLTEQVKTPRPSVNTLETSIPAANPTTALPKPKCHGNSRNRNACFVSVLTQSTLVPITAARPVTAVVLKPHVTRPRQAKTVITKPHSPPKRHINRSLSPNASNFSPKVTPAKAPMVKGNPHHALKDKGVINSRCSRHMTRNVSYFSDLEEINGGYVAFGGNPKGGKISGKGKIKTGKLDFDDVCFVKELKFNLFSVSQMCDKKNSVLFTDTECIVLSHGFKLLDENQVLLRVPRENNMYNVDLKNIVPFRDLTCLFAKATLDEFNFWHRRLGHINFKTINKLVRGNLVRRLPSKVFKNDHTCVACKKGKQHRASYKTKPVSSVNQPLKRLHMNLFGPTFVKSLNKKSYCLVVTNDYSRFTWVFFLATKDETSPILKTFITGIENQLSLKVKIIISDNETEFKNTDLNQLCGMKGIKREFSVPRTPKQNGIAERKNETLIEAARTMLADSLLHILFWAEAVNTACYVQIRILVTKPQNKTPYELYLNTDEDATFEVKEPEFEGRKPQSEVYVSPSSSAQTKKHDDKTKREAKGKSPVKSSTGYRNLSAEFEDFFDNSINEVNAVDSLVPIVGQISTNSTNTFSAIGPSNAAVSPTHGKSSYVDASQYPDDPNMLELKDITYSDDEEDVGTEADFSNLEITITEELLQFKMQKLWVLVDLPNGKRAIGIKWVFRNKKDERGIVVRNKARLVAQRHTQEEGIDYEELFASVTRIKVIRFFLAYASFMIFKVYQMDVKSAFLYGTIKEEVYVCQPLGFEDPDYLDKVYKVVKALYGLHQFPRAWYETLANYLLENGFQRRKIDQTLFIKGQQGDILLVQIYVDDMIFGFTNKDLCKVLGIKCFKAFPLLAMKIPLLEYFATANAEEFPLLIIEFGDSYKAPQEEAGKASESSTKKKGRTVVITTEDMQKRRNDVKARTNLLLALPDEHQLRFNKYEPAIVSHLEFMDVEVEQDDLNQKFLTSLEPEWLMYTIVWRNKDDLDTMSLDDVYNHLKVYEPEVQKKSESNSQNMAFISSSNTSSGKGKVHIASVPTASTQVSTASADVAAASIKMDIKWNMALLSMRADRFWKKTGKKITIQGSAEHQGVKTEVEEKATNKSYMANEEENHALVDDDEAPTEFALMAKSNSSSENEVYDDSLCFKSCRKNIDSLNTKISKLNEELSDSENTLYHYKLGLSQVEARLVEFKTQEIKFCEKIRGLELDAEFKNNKIKYLMNELEQVKKEKKGLDSKLTGFESASKDLDTLLGSQRTDKNKEGLGYSVVPPSCSSLLTFQKRYVLDKIA
nr:Gag-Pol polyprotein [Tanacetum cinerariifolium]